MVAINSRVLFKKSVMVSILVLPARKTGTLYNRVQMWREKGSGSMCEVKLSRSTCRTLRLCLRLPQPKGSACLDRYDVYFQYGRSEIKNTINFYFLPNFILLFWKHLITNVPTCMAINTFMDITVYLRPCIFSHQTWE